MVSEYCDTALKSYGALLEKDRKFVQSYGDLKAWLDETRDGVGNGLGSKYSSLKSSSETVRRRSSGSLELSERLRPQTR